MTCRDGVGVITSALHAEGREFDSRSLYGEENRLILTNAVNILTCTIVVTLDYLYATHSADITLSLT